MKYPANITEILTIMPDYMGFIFYKSSKRYVEDLAPNFVKKLTAVKKVGVFVNASLTVIQEAIELYGLDMVQLHGQEEPDFTAEVRALGVEVIKAFGITKDFDWLELEPYEHTADYFLFDTKTPTHGGSGEPFDWSLLQQYHLRKPYFLSGGLSAENIEAAIALKDSRLFAIDVNSKFELHPGFKDVRLLDSALLKIKKL